MKKFVFVFIISLSVLPLTVGSIQANEAESGKEASTKTASSNQTLKPLDTVQAIEEEVTDYQILDGQIEAVNKSTVSAQTAGIISKLGYDVGDFVEKGALIARISSENQKSGLQQAKASVSQANASINSALASMDEAKAAITRATAAVTQAAATTKEAHANYVVARADFERVKGLFEKRILTQSQYDQANATMRSTLARVESAKASENAAKAERVAAVSGLSSAKANLASAKAGLSSSKADLSKAGEQLGYTEVIAPYSGIVTERHVELGEVVSSGKPIMTGISLAEMRAIADIPQRLILAIRKHKTARVYVDNDNIGIAVDKLIIFPYADPKTNAFKVRASLGSGAKGLFPGVFVKIGFEVGKEKQLVVPTSAVAYRSEVTGIYVINEDNLPIFRQIRVGSTTSDGKIRVLAGLNSGETIAIDPVHAAVYLKTERLKKSESATAKDNH